MEVVSLPTTQNVTISHELAGLGERIASFVIDSIIIWGSIISLHLTISELLTGTSFAELITVVDYLIVFPIFFFYTLASEILMNGQTWGKRLVGLRVISLSGRQAIPSDFILRWIFRLLDIHLSLGTVASLMIATTPNAQRIGGMVSNTAVIRVRPRVTLQLKEILKLQTTENYRPQYSQVIKMKESEMLLIKSAIQRYAKHPNQAHEEALDLLTEKLRTYLQISQSPPDKIVFLKTLLQDYIVLTR